MRFLDTNIVLYAYSTSAEDAIKRQQAHNLMREGNWCISAQVLQEFYSNAVKPKRGLPPLMSLANAQTALNGLAQFASVPLDASLIQQAVVLHQRHQLSYWDGAIIAAALRCGATELLTEDLNAGQVIEGVRVVNPFS